MAPSGVTKSLGWALLPFYSIVRLFCDSMARVWDWEPNCPSGWRTLHPLAALRSLDAPLVSRASAPYQVYVVRPQGTENRCRLVEVKFPNLEMTRQLRRRPQDVSAERGLNQSIGNRVSHVDAARMAHWLCRAGLNHSKS